MFEALSWTVFPLMVIVLPLGLLLCFPHLLALGKRKSRTKVVVDSETADLTVESDVMKALPATDFDARDFMKNARFMHQFLEIGRARRGMLCMKPLSGCVF